MKRFGGVLVVVLVFAGCDPGFDDPHIEKSGPVPSTTVAPATVATDASGSTIPEPTGAPIPGQTDATLNFYRASDAQLQAWQGAECCVERVLPENPQGQRYTMHDVVCLQPTAAGCAQTRGVIRAQYDEPGEGTRMTVATALGGAALPVSGLSETAGEEVDVRGQKGTYRVQAEPGNEFATLEWDAGDGVLVQISVFLFYTTRAELLDVASQLVVDEAFQTLPVGASAVTSTT